MNQKSILIMALTVFTIASINGCTKKELSEPVKAGSYTGDFQHTETEEERVMSVSKDGTTVNVTVSEELKKEAEDYTAYIQMQQDKISLLLGEASTCDSLDEYKSIAQNIITIANQTKEYPVPDNNEELKQITADAMDEIIYQMEKSLQAAEENGKEE